MHRVSGFVDITGREMHWPRLPDRLALKWSRFVGVPCILANLLPSKINCELSAGDGVSLIHPGRSKPRHHFLYHPVVLSNVLNNVTFICFHMIVCLSFSTPIFSLTISISHHHPSSPFHPLPSLLSITPSSLTITLSCHHHPLPSPSLPPLTSPSVRCSTRWTI